MNCTRAEELFSDYHEGSLAPPLAGEVATHLETCAACRDLYRAFGDVTDTLRTLPVPAPRDALSRDLVELVSAASQAPERPRARRFAAPTPRLVAAGSWLAVAAALLLVMVLRPPELATELSRTTSRTARHVYSFAVQTYLQTERWIEDLNVLRMTVGVAFEDRIDQINEQLKDLEDAGRRPQNVDEGEDEQSRHHLERDHSARSFS